MTQRMKQLPRRNLEAHQQAREKTSGEHVDWTRLRGAKILRRRGQQIRQAKAKAKAERKFLSVGKAWSSSCCRPWRQLQGGQMSGRTDGREDGWIWS